MTEVTDRGEEARHRRFRPYPEYRDSGVEWLGEIPAHWEPARLWRLCSTTTGATPTKENPAYWNGEVPWVTPKDMKRRVIATSEDLITQQALDETGLKLITPQVVLVVVRGMILAHSLPVAVTAASVTINQDMKALRLIDGVDAFYFAWALDGLTRGIVVTVVGEAAHGTRAIRMDQWRSLVVPLPPHPEQQAIVDFLDRETAKIDALVARKERLIELLQEKRTALITRAVTRGLDPLTDTRATGSHVFPVVPKDWNLWKMRRLIRQVKRPIMVRPDREYREIGIRSWGRGIFHKDPVRGALLEEKSVFRPDPGDFVLNIVFAWEGAVAVVSEYERGMIASHRFPTFRPSDHVDLDYLLMVLQSDQGRRLMEVNSPGAAGRNKTLRIGQFLDEELPLPSIEQQRATVAEFREEEGRLATLAITIGQAIDHLRELRTALISAAVTGKIDVREAMPR